MSAVAVCAALATTGSPVARAEDARALLLGAIANTKGAYLVYNFGGQFAAPFLAADGRAYTLNNGGHLMAMKNASGRLNPRLLVDSHQGYQSRCERTPGARTGEGLWQASETYAPLAAWQVLGQPTIAVNANFFDVRGQKGGSWRDTKCSSPLGAYVDNTRGQGRANAAVTGTLAYAGKQGLSGGDERWAALATMILPMGGAPYVVMPKGTDDYDSATPVIQRLLDQNARFVAVAGIGLLAPGETGQLNDNGPSAAHDRRRLQPGDRPALRLPGRQLHPGQHPGPFPWPRRRQRPAARRRRLVGDRVAPRHRRYVERCRVTARELRYPSSAVRFARAGPAQLACLQLSSAASSPGFRREQHSAFPRAAGTSAIPGGTAA